MSHSRVWFLKSMCVSTIDKGVQTSVNTEAKCEKTLVSSVKTKGKWKGGEKLVKWKFKK